MHYNDRGEPCECGFGERLMRRQKLRPDNREVVGKTAMAADPYWSKKADYYHVAPTVDRERIRQHGLQPSKPKLNPDWNIPEHAPDAQFPEGVYAWPQSGKAYDYAERLETARDTPMDVWQIPEHYMTYDDPDIGPQARRIPVPVMDPELHEGPEHRVWDMSLGSPALPYEQKWNNYKPLGINAEQSDYDQKWQDRMGRMGATDAKPYIKHMFHPSPIGHLRIKPGVMATSDEQEAKNLGGVDDHDPQGGAVHKVTVRFQRPLHYFGEWPGFEQAKLESNGRHDGIVIHYPANTADPSRALAAREWAIAIDPGAILPGHVTA